MYRGDYLNITPSGVQVRAKSVEQVGIYDKSKCWGLWFQNPIRDENRLALMPRQSEHCHLIISPFHPSSWPFLLRIQVWLVDRLGSLAMVAEELRKLGLSILATECAASGFGQATWNIVAEVMGLASDPRITPGQIQDMKRKKTKFDRENSHARVTYRASQMAATSTERVVRKEKATSTPKKGRAESITSSPTSILPEIAKLMRIYEQKVHQVLGQLQDLERRQSDRFKWQHFLDWEDVENSLMDRIPKSPRELTKEMSSFRVDWVWTLAAFSCHGGGPESPLAFHYDADRGILRCSDESQLDSILGKRSTAMPAIGSFCAEHQFFRINPLTEGVLQHDILQLTLKYRLTSSSPDGMLHAPGLLERVAKELQQRKIDILLINNQWTDYRYQSESGRIRMLIDAPCEQKHEIASATQRAAEASIPDISSTEEGDLSGRSQGHRLDVEGVEIRPASHRTMFLSYHGGHPRQESWLAIIKNAAQKVGFHVSPVDTNTEAVTGAVLDALHESDVMLQILSPNPDETAENIRLHWLDYEYGAAAGLRLPAIRMVDVARITITEWEGMLRTHRDQAVIPFRSDISDEDLYKCMLRAIEKLAAALNERC